MKEYITSDLHFGHKNIIKYENRPFNSVEEMDKAIINMWNKTVEKDDLVYILGDFSWYKGQKTNEILNQLNGKKILVIGNHDENFLNDKDFDRKLFEEICYYKEIQKHKTKIVMSHYPIISWNGKLNGAFHLYGHVHTIKNEDTDYMYKLEKIFNCFNICLDKNKRLLDLEEIICKEKNL